MHWSPGIYRFGAFIRLTVGVLAVMVVINLFEANPYKGIKQHLKELTSGALLWLIGAIFVGTFLALWLQQVALKHANPAIAQTLIATSPLFILIIYLIKGQRVSAKSALGTLVAVGGISLFFVQ